MAQYRRYQEVSRIYRAGPLLWVGRQQVMHGEQWVARKTYYCITSILATWVMLRVQLLESLARYLCIDLCGREIDVPEQHLHHAQIGTVI
jgi:hypothetical protein